jgi:hypothetical protein
MRTYKVNNIEHTVFDPEDPVEHLDVVTNWRVGKVGQWVKTDDDCVMQILRRGTMMRPKGKIREVAYIGTCTGTYPIYPHSKLDSSRRINIYSFSGNKLSDDIVKDRENLTSKEGLFVLYLTQGIRPQDAYLKAFPTSDPHYANMKAGQLVKTERIRTAMKEELKPVLEELGIDEKYVIKGIKNEAELAEKSDTKLKALFKLADIMDLEDKNQTKVTQISAAQFKGFIGEDIDRAIRPKEISDE